MASILTSSQSLVLATAMAVSGTVILLAFRLQKSSTATLFSIAPVANSLPRSCISSDRKKGSEKKKKKKVHFAKDVVDPIGNGEQFRRFHTHRINGNVNASSSSSPSPASNSPATKTGGGMPANRLALYNGILRDRLLHRATHAY